MSSTEITGRALSQSRKFDMTDFVLGNNCVSSDDQSSGPSPFQSRFLCL